MFVGPSGVAAGLVNHSEDSVGTYEIPRIDRLTGLIALQVGRIDRLNAPVGKAGTRSSAVEQSLVDIDSFVELGGGS
jgi:hypothetical protein